MFGQKRNNFLFEFAQEFRVKMGSLTVFFLVSFLTGSVICYDDKPVIHDLLIPSKLVEGKKFYLTCHLNSGKQPISFAWYHSDELVKPSDNIAISSNDESSQLTIKEMRLADSGQYVCKVENAYGSDSRRVDLKLNGRIFVTFPQFFCLIKATDLICLFDYQSNRAGPKSCLLWLRFD